MVIIKDMEMPKNCLDCPIRNYRDDEGNRCDLTGLYNRQDCCPLVEIKIPEELYETLKNPEILSTMYHASRAADAVRSGTLLPKGHGDLIDRNDLKYERYNSYAYAIANAPTIVEADKESEDKEV